MNKKRLFSAVLAVFMVATMFAGTFKSDFGFASENKNIDKITIVHTNDTHGRYKYDEKSAKDVLGFDRLKTIADASDADIILDGGDTFHGLSFATVDKGKSIAKIMNKVGYTAMTPGNHDFNYGADYLKEEIAPTMNGEILSCNIIDEKTGETFFKAYTTKEVTSANGDVIKIGILGVTSPDIYGDTAPANVKGLKFADPVKYSKIAVDQLKKEGCNVIVAISHMGNGENFQYQSKMLAQEVDGIDLIVDGHSHREYKEVVEKANGQKTLIVQSGYYFHNAGLVTLDYDMQKQQVVNLDVDDSQLINYSKVNEIEPDAAVKETILAIEKAQDEILNKVVGHTPKELEYSWELIRCKQTNLGNVIGDAYIKATGADVAFENAGGIRSNVNAGDITRRDIINVSPFGNYVVTKELTGQQILDLIEDSLERQRLNQEAWDKNDYDAWPNDSGASLQIAGIDVAYDMANDKGHRIVSAKIGGQDVQLSKKYLVATNQFVAIDNEDYKALAAAKTVNEYGSCEEILASYLGDEEWQKSLGKNYLSAYTGEPGQNQGSPNTDQENDSTIDQTDDSTNDSSNESASDSESKDPVKTGDDSGISIFSIIVCIASFAISVYIYIQLTRKK